MVSFMMRFWAREKQEGSSAQLKNKLRCCGKLPQVNGVLIPIIIKGCAKEQVKKEENNGRRQWRYLCMTRVKQEEQVL